MKTIQASDEKEIAAPSDLIYRCLADYRNHHFNLLPAACTDAAVEEGGLGAGTVIRARVRLAGKPHPFAAPALSGVPRSRRESPGSGHPSPALSR